MRFISDYPDSVNDTRLNMDDHNRLRSLYDEKVEELGDEARAAAFAAKELYEAKEDVEESYEEFAATTAEYLANDIEALDENTVEVMDSIEYVGRMLDNVDNRDGVPQSVDDDINAMQDIVDNM